MSGVTAFEMVPGLVQQTQHGITTGEFDVGAPILGASPTEDWYGIRGYAELAQISVPVLRTVRGIEMQKFHVFGVTEGAPFLPDATANAMNDGRA
jgi:hypothetical protein